MAGHHQNICSSSSTESVSRLLFTGTLLKLLRLKKTMYVLFSKFGLFLSCCSFNWRFNRPLFVLVFIVFISFQLCHIVSMFVSGYIQTFTSASCPCSFHHFRLFMLASRHCRSLSFTHFGFSCRPWPFRVVYFGSSVVCSGFLSPLTRSLLKFSRHRPLTCSPDFIAKVGFSLSQDVHHESTIKIAVYPLEKITCQVEKQT